MADIMDAAKTPDACAPEDDAKLTPLMRQFWQIKREHQDKVLLFRMGDFYEMFYEDAVIAAPILNIALTSRNKKSVDETPMCGVPYHSISGPISKLLAAGYKVAICDQLEDPSEAKGIVRRGVTRILSPGMVYDPDTLGELQANFVCAYDERSVAFLDATTGEALCYEVANTDEVERLMQLLRPSEIILTSDQRAMKAGALLVELLPLDAHLTVFDRVDTGWPQRFEKAPLSALRLLTYAVAMQGTEILSVVKDFSEKRLQDTMHLGARVMQHLEVFESYRGQPEGSLFHAMNRTRTSGGARLLKRWLQFPLIHEDKILARQTEVQKWFDRLADLKPLRSRLSQMGDIERRLSKMAYSSCHPRDLLALAHALDVGLSVSPYCVRMTEGDQTTARQVFDLIERAIDPEPPAQMKAGGFIQKGFDAALDGLIEMAENSNQLLLQMEARERDATGITSLKIRYNSVFGYYIEVTNVHKDKVPKHYHRKQTLTNAERYITEELRDLEQKVLSARSKRVELEDSLFAQVRREILGQNRALLRVAEIWSELDVVSSLAWLAVEQNYARPVFVEGAAGVRLLGSRHCVIEQQVKKTFVPNDIEIAGGECVLLTGPNMAGKSTLMRQVAVTALMAQIGSFVPCREARLMIFDQIFTRIGASDFLSEGLSTFMVEMQETAELLNGLTDRTLVVLDEVGRGTSTYDGMSLAQAILEHIVQHGRAVTLFATHYHELTMLSARYPQILNRHMAIQEAGKKGQAIQFLYVLRAGPANKSYGIHVAQLAGIPRAVVTRAEVLLRQHELGVGSGLEAAAGSSQMSLMEAASTAAEPEPHPVLEKLRTVDLKNLTPLQALTLIDEWQREAADFSTVSRA